MKHFLLTALMGMALISATTGTFPDGRYELDVKSSEVIWTGKAAVGNFALSGSLDAKAGGMEIKAGQLTGAQVIMDMKSISSEEKNLEKHLKNEDFFDVKKYPTSSFSMKDGGDVIAGENVVTGQLTVKETEAAETFKVDIQLHGDAIHLTFDVAIDRTKYGVVYNSPTVFKDLKNHAIADEIHLKGTLVFQKAK